MKICKNCGNEHDGSYGSGIFCSKHCRYVYIGKQNKHPVCNWPKNDTNRRAPFGRWKCCWCDSIFETRSKLIDHKHKNHQKDTIWNKGLTKETNDILKKASETLSNSYKSGRLKSSFKDHHWSDEDKKRISEQRKKFLDDHPDKVPFLLNHSSKESYPEKCFKKIFKENNIDLKYHFQVGRYQLDFYNEELKKYVEIDGEQHYKNDQLIERDIERTQILFEKGWTGMRIRWKEFLKMSDVEKHELVNKVKNFLYKDL